jgi:hypothetical protein
VKDGKRLTGRGQRADEEEKGYTDYTDYADYTDR